MTFLLIENLLKYIFERVTTENALTAVEFIIISYLS